MHDLPSIPECVKMGLSEKEKMADTVEKAEIYMQIKRAKLRTFEFINICTGN